MICKEKMTQYTVPCKNDGDSINRVCQVLAREGICITGFMCQTMGDVGLVRFLCDGEGKLVRRPLEQAGYEVFEHPCFRLEVPNRPGELARLTKCLADEDVKLLNIYGCTNGEEMGKMCLVVDRPEKMMQIFQKSGEMNSAAAR